MSDRTTHGVRADTTITKTNWLFVIFVGFVVVVSAREPWAVSASRQQAVAAPTQAQQRPVFRAGAHYVRVDAYPTGKDGRILEGLTKDDFEIVEDGRPQAIENAEYVTFDTWTPDGERTDPRTQQDAYDLLADPTWRVFVIVIDPTAYGLRGQYYLRAPLHEFIERNLGPHDLFGLLTTQNQWTDLQLAQKTAGADAVLDSRAWLDWGDNIEQRPAPALLYADDTCGISPVLGRKALDTTYTLLEGLVNLLGLIREEKKSIIFVTKGLETPGPDKAQQSAGLHGIPGIPHGPVAPGPHGRPPTGRTPPPLGPTGHGDRIVTPTVEANCAAERMRLSKNSNWDGTIRQIKVKLKPKGQAVRARRQYRAPTLDEITAIVASPPAAAAPPTAVETALRAIDAKAGAAEPPRTALVDAPQAYRSRGRTAPEPAGVLHFTRAERLRVEWQVRQALDRRSVRLLDRLGHPLPVEIPLAEGLVPGTLVVELPLSAFARADYLIELTAGAGSVEERSLVAFRVQ